MKSTRTAQTKAQRILLLRSHFLDVAGKCEQFALMQPHTGALRLQMRLDRKRNAPLKSV